MGTTDGGDQVEEEVDEKGQAQDDEDFEAAKSEGRWMYMGLFSYFYTGGYRMLPAKDFKCEILIGYVIEICSLIIPMMYCEVSNNAAGGEADLSAIQSVAILIKIFSLLVLFFEAVLMGCEFRYIYMARKSEIRAPGTEKL